MRFTRSLQAFAPLGLLNLLFYFSAPLSIRDLVTLNEGFYLLRHLLREFWFDILLLVLDLFSPSGQIATHEFHIILIPLESLFPHFNKACVVQSCYGKKKLIFKPQKDAEPGKEHCLFGHITCGI